MGDNPPQTSWAIFDFFSNKIINQRGGEGGGGGFQE